MVINFLKKIMLILLIIAFPLQTHASLFSYNLFSKIPNVCQSVYEKCNEYNIGIAIGISLLLGSGLLYYIKCKSNSYEMLFPNPGINQFQGKKESCQINVHKRKKYNPNEEMRKILFDKPSAYMAGAQMKKGGIVIDRTKEDEIWCLLTGFKKLFWLGFSEDGEMENLIADVKKLHPDFNSDIGILQYEHYIFGCELNKLKMRPLIQGFAYTADGKVNALLFAKHYNETRLNDINDYLTGFLLGYNEEDIYFYYECNFEFPEQKYTLDKQLAKKFIEKNTPSVEEWALKSNKITFIQ